MAAPIKTPSMNITAIIGLLPLIRDSFDWAGSTVFKKKIFKLDYGRPFKQQRKPSGRISRQAAVHSTERASG